MELCLGLQSRSQAGQGLDRDRWNYAVWSTLNTTGLWEVMTTPGSLDSLKTSWNRSLHAVCWTGKLCRRTLFHFIMNVSWLRVVLRDLFKSEGLFLGNRRQTRHWSLWSKSLTAHSARWHGHLLEGKVARGAESDLPVFYSQWLTGREMMVSPQLLNPWGRLANSDHSSLYLREFGIRKIILVANVEI